MNDNYLWDRSGEPDTEIQKLEELLGTLRYQPRPLEIPAELKLQRRRPFIPWAIAAAIALLMIAAGLWLRLSRSQTSPRLEVKTESPLKPKEFQSSLPRQSEQALAAGTAKTPLHRKRSTSSLVAVNRRVARPLETRQPQLTEEELAQKEQLVMALRLVSAKLNMAQRKTQGLPQPSIIRNQHKIG